MYRLEIRIPGQPQATNELHRYGWQKKSKIKKGWEEVVAICCLRQKPIKPLQFCHIKAVLHNARNFDYDGAVASLKPIVDGLQKAGIIFNDSYKRTGPWDVTQVHCKKGDEFIEIIVEEKG